MLRISVTSIVLFAMLASVSLSQTPMITLSETATVVENSLSIATFTVSPAPSVRCTHR